MDRYIMYRELPGGRRRYVSGFTPSGEGGPRYSDYPHEAMTMDRSMTRKVDQSTPDHLQVESWTPALQEMLEEHQPPPPVIHYGYGGPGDTVHTACDNLVHRDSTTTDHSCITCDVCRRKVTHQVDHSDIVPRDIPVGLWPIKGRYFMQPIQSLPASYWVWVIDKTQMIHENSYLYRFFKENETTLRRRAKKKL